MKKFLSLVLAVIMTMSLVTISASAAEYKDFTDKDEIQYEEAVAVLNRLGIITGYSEGDFRPEGELTRGAAAKIIVSLLIGPEAANNVSPTSAPYKDVPLDHTFAGVIAFCKTAGIISGYSDGSFQPGGTLTGYAFSKMLLGALGYDSSIEHFTGPGWNNNVNYRASEAGLFDRLSFKGNDPVNREEAAQLALNTLKATMVEYTGGIDVTTSDGSTMKSPATRTYKISNQDYATHINNRKASNVGNATGDTHYTVEFGEEHFVDLRMKKELSVIDQFGRPSNEWSYKKSVIGTYPITPDKLYTEQVAHNVITESNASKARALELSGLGIDKARVFVNGAEMETTKDLKNLFGSEGFKDVGQIADLTDNGTAVEVYIEDNGEDEISHIVVIKTQLMEVKRLSKDSVALDLYDGGSANKGVAAFGFNQAAINEKIQNVETGDDYYEMLSGMKAGDLVAVVPVYDGGKYYVAEAYAPETVSGALKKVTTYGTSEKVSTVGVTVGDTAYDVALWNKDLVDIDGDKLDVTRKDVTLTLDKYGNAMLAKDVGATNDFMVVGSFYKTLVNNKMVTYVKGWDISGEELELNLGSKFDGKTADNHPVYEGDLVYYTNDTDSSADWKIEAKRGVYTVSQADNYNIEASNSRIKIDGGVNYTAGDDNPWIDKGIKFIYLSFNKDHEVDSITIKNGVQKVSHDDLAKNSPSSTNSAKAQMALKLNDKKTTDDKSTVKAVVIKNEANDATASNMLYVVNYIGSAGKDENGDIVYEYTVAMNGTSGLVDDDMTIFSTNKLSRGDWARYTEVKNDNYENFYKLSIVDQIGRATSTMVAKFAAVNDRDLNTSGYPVANNKSLVRLDGTTLKAIDGTPLPTSEGNGEDPTKDYLAPNIKKTYTADNKLGLGDTEADYLVNLRNATWVDLTDKGIDNYEDLADLVKEKEINLENVRVSMIFNDDTNKDSFRHVAVIVVQSVTDTTTGTGKPGSDTVQKPSSTVSDMGLGEWNVNFVDFDRALGKLYPDAKQATVEVQVTDLPDWVPADAKVTYTVQAQVDGVDVRGITVNGSYNSGATALVTAVKGTTTTLVLDSSVPVYENSKVAVQISKVTWDKVTHSVTKPDGVTVDVGTTTDGTFQKGDLLVKPTTGTTNTVKVTVPDGDEIKTVTITQNGETITPTSGGSGGVYTISVNAVGEVKVTVTTESVVLPKPTEDQIKENGKDRGTVNPGAGKTLNAAYMKAQLPGMYSFTDAHSDALHADSSDGLYINPNASAEDCLAFVYQRTGAQNATYTLKITSGSTTYYTERFDPTSDTKDKGLFIVQVSMGNHSTVFHNTSAGSGVMAHGPLASGQYTWEIVSSVDNTIAKGNFTIENVADAGEVKTLTSKPTSENNIDTAIKALDNGAYVGAEWMVEADGNGGIGDFSGGYAANRVIKYDVVLNGSEKTTLSVYNDAGLVYTETTVDDMAHGGHFFYIQVEKGDAEKIHNMGTLANDNNWTPGNYRYIVRGNSSQAVLVQGTFVVNAAE